VIHQIAEASVVSFRYVETRETVLDGFTITGRRGTTIAELSDEVWMYQSPVGGGILIDGASPTVRNCKVTWNRCDEVVRAPHSPRKNGGAAVHIGAFESDCVVPFSSGDSNGDGRIDISDAVFTLNYLFTGGRRPDCLDAADTDDSGTLDLTDGHLINVLLFLGGSVPRTPTPFGCAVDPTDDDLGCFRSYCQ